MTKYQQIFSLVSLLFLIILGLLFWRASIIFTDFAGMFPDAKTGPDLALNTQTNRHELTTGLIASPQIADNRTDNNSFGHYETIEETIARIKRDVYVTGAIIGTPGREFALFRIEGMPDRSFSINTQLMDGFIITGITDNRVILKNQTGNEIIFLDVGK